MEVIQANFRERLSLEPKDCDEEKGWPETALGWVDLHPESEGLMAPWQRWEGGRSPISGNGASREPVTGGHVVRGPQRGPSQASVVTSGPQKQAEPGSAKPRTGRASLWRPPCPRRLTTAGPAGCGPGLSRKSRHLQLLTVVRSGQPCVMNWQNTDHAVRQAIVAAKMRNNDQGQKQIIKKDFQQLRRLS